MSRYLFSLLPPECLSDGNLTSSSDNMCIYLAMYGSLLGLGLEIYFVPLMGTYFHISL